MPQRLQVLLPGREDMTSDPTTVSGLSQPLVNLAPGNAVPSSGLHGHPHICVQMLTYTQINNKNKSKIK